MILFYIENRDDDDRYTAGVLFRIYSGRDVSGDRFSRVYDVFPSRTNRV